jgi:hypothetical protein
VQLYNPPLLKKVDSKKKLRHNYIRASCKVRLYGTKFALRHEGIFYTRGSEGGGWGRPKGCKICTSDIKQIEGRNDLLIQGVRL